jgi:hypothetical protein
LTETSNGISSVARLHTLLEFITKDSIEEWRKSFLAFTKNTRRIQNGKDLYDVRMAYIIWRKNFEEFFYKKLMGLDTKGARTDNQFARSKVWDLVVFDPFDVVSGAYWTVVSILGKETQGIPPKGYNKELWDALYALWNSKERTKNYSRLQ